MRYIPLVFFALLSTAFTLTAKSAEKEADFDVLMSLSLEDLVKVKITSASRFSETSLTSPSSVNVIEKKDWERRGARRTSDAFGHLPGVMLLPNPTGSSLIQTRGYGTGSVRGKATLLDGVPINSFVYGTDMFSTDNMELATLERIELVRGPSSSLYGSDAFHSAVAYKTHSPKENEFEINAAAGIESYYNGAVRGSARLGDSWLGGVTFAGSGEGDQSREFPFISNTTGQEETAERELKWDSQSMVLQFKQNQKAGQGAEIGLYYNNSNFDDFEGAGNASFPTEDEDRAAHDGRMWMVRAAYKHNIADDLSLQAKLYYWSLDHNQNFRIPIGADVFLDESEFSESRQGISLIFKQSNDELKTRWSVETTFEKAEIDDADNERREITSGQTIRTPNIDYMGLSQSISGLSIDANTEMADKWNLVWGGRLDHYNTFGSEVNPRVGIIYQPTENSALKAVYGEAFRAPNAVELEGTNFALGDNNLKPEQLKSVELAFVYSPEKWEFEWTIFQNKWEERIVLKPITNNTFTSQYVNSGENRSTGTELTARLRLSNWDIEASTSYIYSKNLEVDRWISVFPKFILNLGVGYTWPEDNVELFLANRFHDRVLIGDQFQAPFNVDEAPAYFRTDLTMIKRLTPDWQLGLAIRNLFDRDNVVTSVVNSFNGIPDIPIQVALTTQYSF